MNIDDRVYYPYIIDYAETDFGGELETTLTIKDILLLIYFENENNWAIFPINPHSYNSINYNNLNPNPAPPSNDNILSTDDRGRDVMARLIYGFRLSVVFALALTASSIVIGLFFGAIQGYFAGRIDLYLQRFIEIWGSMPELYILIIFASIFEPSILLLIFLLSLLDG